MHDELQQSFQKHQNSLQRWEYLKKAASRYQVYSVEIGITNTVLN